MLVIYSTLLKRSIDVRVDSDTVYVLHRNIEEKNRNKIIVFRHKLWCSKTRFECKIAKDLTVTYYWKELIGRPTDHVL